MLIGFLLRIEWRAARPGREARHQGSDPLFQRERQDVGLKGYNDVRFDGQKLGSGRGQRLLSLHSGR